MIVIKRINLEDRHGSPGYFNCYYGHNEYEYIPDQLNETTLGITMATSIFGISSFGNADNNYYVTPKRINMFGIGLTVIYEGFHFIIPNTPSAEELGTANIFKFLVPKGSEVFLGKTGCGVSNKIIMLKP